ncbi:sporulation protein [Nocardiopsis mangrovi]|uniref:Sporulation protein n=1 Tax=Nocardiopsis mangrovi TaxID=1179818 RepID=A0ABV9E3F7_9ACTN
MGIKRLLTRLGWGGATVETVLRDESVPPGGTIHGRIDIDGGEVDQHIDRLTAGLVVRLQDYSDVEFRRVEAGTAFPVAGGGSVTREFTMDVPWDMPVTVHRGQPLKGMDVGVNTQLHIAAAVDPGDFDPIAIAPLPAQAAVLDALAEMGFDFYSAVVKHGRIADAHTGAGTDRQRSPLFQEIKFYPPSGSRSPLDKLDLTFASDADATDVILRAETFDGVMVDAVKTSTVFTAAHGEAAPDWPALVTGWLAGLPARRA